MNVLSKTLLVLNIALTSCSSHYATQKPEETHVVCLAALPQLIPFLQEQQQKTLGITHSSTPRLLFSDSKEVQQHYSIDDILAHYCSSQNSILLSKKYFPLQTQEGANGLLHHELAHFFMDSLAERLWNKDWPPHDTLSLFNDTDVGIKVVSEGTATYFEKKMNNIDCTQTECILFLQKPYGFIFYFNHDLFYERAYHVVKPIIDQHGERGIAKLMQDSPTKQDLTDVFAYQQRILHSLNK